MQYAWEGNSPGSIISNTRLRLGKRGLLQHVIFDKVTTSLLRTKRLEILILRVKGLTVKLKWFVDVKELIKKKTFRWVRHVTKSKPKSWELLEVTLVFPRCSICPPAANMETGNLDLALENQWITRPGWVKQGPPWTFMSEDSGSKCSLKLQPKYPPPSLLLLGKSLGVYLTMEKAQTADNTFYGFCTVLCQNYNKIRFQKKTACVHLAPVDTRKVCRGR